MEKEPITAVAAAFQLAEAQGCLWYALVDELLCRGAVDHAELAAKISQVRTQAVHKGEIFDAITCDAMRELAQREFANLEDAPEWVRKMCSGELIVKAGEHPGRDGLVVAGKRVE